MDIGQGYQLSLIGVLGRVQSFASMQYGKRKMLWKICMQTMQFPRQNLQAIGVRDTKHLRNGKHLNEREWV